MFKKRPFGRLYFRNEAQQSAAMLRGCASERDSSETTETASEAHLWCACEAVKVM